LITAACTKADGEDGEGFWKTSPFLAYPPAAHKTTTKAKMRTNVYQLIIQVKGQCLVYFYESYFSNYCNLEAEK
jgi:hypothetical protein